MRVLFTALVAFVVSVNASVMTIDLGSEFLKVGILSRGKPIQIVENIAAKRKSETVVSFDNKDVRHFSNGALKLSTRFPARTFRFLPTLLGHEYDSRAMRIYQERFPFHNLSADERGMVQITDTDGIVHTVEEYMAMIFQFCVDITQKFGEEDVSSAIVVVPPFFSQVERNAVTTAAGLIDLKVTQLMNSDVAAAINYGSFRADEFKKKTQRHMIVDMGSSSTTATLFSYRWKKNKDIGRQQPTLEVISTAYDRNLGGLDFDLILRDLLVERFHETKGVKEDVTKNTRAMARLLIEAEKVKKVLSANKKTTCYIENLAENKDFKTMITREEFEKRAADLLSRVAGPVEGVLREIGKFETPLDISDISSTIIIGGGLRIPVIKEILKKAIGGRELSNTINGDEAIALGAAYRAADISPSHRVPQKWTIKSAVVYPVHVSFMRPVHTNADGVEEPAKEVSKVLFSRMNAVPQKKTMTFTKHVDDFNLNVYYADLEVVGTQSTFLGDRNLTTVKVKLSDALKDKDPKTFEAVKVQFSMDVSGLLSVDGIDAVFNETKGAAEDSGVLGGMFNNLWGSDEDTAPVAAASDEKADGESGDIAKDSTEKTADKAEAKEDEESSQDEDGKAEAEDAPDAEKSNNGSGEGEATDGETASEETPKKKATKATKSKSKSSKTKTQKGRKGSNEDGIVVSEVAFEEEVTTSQSGMQKDQFTKTKATLAALAKADRERLERADANSNLEAYALDCRMNLFEDAWEEVTTEEEREQIREQSNEVSDWLYEDGLDATTGEYKDKLNELRKLMAPALYKKTEKEQRPKMVTQMRDVLNMTLVFVNSSRVDDKWRKPADIDALELLMNQTEDWLVDQLNLQEKAELHVDPVVTTKMIADKKEKLTREMLKELRRIAPPPPKKLKKKENVTKADSSEGVDNATDTEKGATDDEKATEEDERPDAKDEKGSEKASTEGEAGTEGEDAIEEDGNAGDDSGDDSGDDQADNGDEEVEIEKESGDDGTTKDDKASEEDGEHTDEDRGRADEL